MERFCADSVSRSVNHPPTQPGPWSAGQLVSRCHWSGGGAAGRVSERVKTCCKCLNCCHNKQLWQQLPPFWVVNATTAHAAIVQPDERRREPGPLGGSLVLVPVVVAVLRWSAVAVEVGPMQSAGTDPRR